MKFPAADDWIPARLAWRHGPPFVEWCYVGRRRFTGPFFESTLQQCMQLPFNKLFRRKTTLDELADWQTTQPDFSPSGFIFHMSRCGSTLISQMLAALPQHVVLSEPRPIDETLSALRATPELTESRRIAYLRAMIGALGRPRFPDERRLFVKFEPQHVQDLPLLRAAFPETPWIFVYRDPLEVMVSQHRNCAIMPSPDLLFSGRLDFGPMTAVQMPSTEFVARVLALWLRAAEAEVRGDAFRSEAAKTGTGAAHGLLVHYEQLPQAVGTTIADHFGLKWSEEELARMRPVAGFHAKFPEVPFAADQAAKRAGGTAEIVAATERWLAPAYQRLETLRAAADLASGHRTAR